MILRPISDAGWLKVPEPMVDEVAKTDDPVALSAIIAHYERDFAHQIFGENEDYFYCDHGAEILSHLLQLKQIPHYHAVGYCDEGSSHSYIVLMDNTPLDPTDQGFGDRNEESLRFVPVRYPCTA